MQLHLLPFFSLHSLVVSSFVRFDGLGRLDRMTATTNRLFHPSSCSTQQSAKVARNNHSYFLAITESRPHICVGSSRTSRGDRERWRGRGDISLGFSLDVSIFLTVLFQNRRRDAFVAISKSSGLFDKRKPIIDGEKLC